MSNTSSLFSPLTVVNHHIVLADGSTHPIVCKNVLQPHQSLSLLDNLYAPNIPFNLLSINQVTKVLNCLATFSPQPCIFQDLETKKTISFS